MNQETELFLTWEVIDVIVDEAIQAYPEVAQYVTATFCKEAFHQRIVLENVAETEGIIHDMIKMVLSRVDWKVVSDEVCQRAKAIIESKKLNAFDDMYRCLVALSLNKTLSKHEQERIITCINKAKH